MNDQPEKTPVELGAEAISPGIAVGEVFLFRPIDLNGLGSKKFIVENLAQEIGRLDATISRTREQLQSIIAKQPASSTVSDIFSVQLRLLDDSELFNEIRSMIRSESANIEYVLARKIASIETQFRHMDNEVIRTRILDIQDLYHRLLRNSLEIEHVRANPLKRVQSPVIFVAEKLLPSDLALLDHDKLLAIILEEGSRVSHVSILAKALAIPALIKAIGATSVIKAHDMVIVDAVKGKIIVNPNETQRLAYTKREKRFREASLPGAHACLETGCCTSDGVTICLEANAGSVMEVSEAFTCGAESIGLLRTELFYMSQAALPSVEEEYQYYAQILSLARGRGVTIRLLDLGADKNLPYLPRYEEENPQMGIRGIRFLLHNPQLFNSHLRSIVRASSLGPIKLLIPFVTTVRDVRSAVEAVDEVCKQEGQDRAALRVGIMVEIPSAALTLNDFWPGIDFVTIGTNDLVQYLFAASREDGNVEEYRQPMHPAALGIIRLCVVSAARHNKEISICGEIASDPLTAAVLVGLGLRRLSMQSACINRVRTALSTYSLRDLEQLSKKALRQKQ